MLGLELGLGLGLFMARGSGRVRITSLEWPRMVIRELYWDLQS